MNTVDGRVKPKLTAKTQLRLVFLAIFVVLVGAALLVDHRMRVINEKSTETAENWMPSIVAVNAINTATSDYRAAEGLHILSTDEAAMDRYEKEMDRLIKEIADWRAKYKALISSEEERALYLSFSRKYDDYVEASKQTVALSRRNANEQAAAQLKASGRVFDDMSDELIKLVKLNTQGGEASSAEGDVVYADSQLMLYWMGGGMFVLGVVMVFVLERRIFPGEAKQSRSRARELLSLHRRAPSAVLIVATGITLITVSVLSNRLFTGMTSSTETDELSLIGEAVEYNLHSTEKDALSKAESVADLPSVRALLAAHDRTKLLAELQAMFQTQTNKYGIAQAQFHVPPATAFLSLHSPEVFGEDLSKSRPIILTANREQLPQSGFSITAAGPGMFGVAPMFDEASKHIGSFEVGLTFERICDDLHSALNMEVAIYVDEDALWSHGKGLDKAIFSAQNRAGRYIRYYATNSGLMKKLVGAPDLDDPRAKYGRKIDGVHYGVVLTPIRDDSGEVRAVIAAAKDLTSLRAGEGQSLVWQALMATVSIVILAGLILIVVRGVLVDAIERIASSSEENTEATDEVTPR